MSETKTPSELIADIDCEIDKLKRDKLAISYSLNQLIDKINQLQQRKQSLLNYLNSDDLNSLHP